MDIVATPVPQAKRSKKETVSPTRVVDMNEEQYLGYDSLEGYLEYLKDTEHYATISPYMEKQSYITTGMQSNPWWTGDASCATITLHSTA